MENNIISIVYLWASLISLLVSLTTLCLHSLSNLNVSTCALLDVNAKTMEQMFILMVFFVIENVPPPLDRSIIPTYNYLGTNAFRVDNNHV